MNPESHLFEVEVKEELPGIKGRYRRECQVQPAFKMEIILIIMTALLKEELLFWDSAE